VIISLFLFPQMDLLRFLTMLPQPYPLAVQWSETEHSEPSGEWPAKQARLRQRRGTIWDFSHTC
jgi:hypothetical protein